MSARARMPRPFTAAKSLLPVFWPHHGPVELAGDIGRLGLVAGGQAVLPAQVAGLLRARFVLRRAGGGAHQAPAVAGVHQKDEAALAVVEQVFLPAKVLIVAGFAPGRC